MKPIPVEFHIGPLLVHTYGIGLAVTFWFVYRYFERRLTQRGYPTAWVTPMFVWVIITAVIGARAMHVLSTLGYYERHPGDVFAIWHGGLSSFGGLILAVPTAIVVALRRCPELSLGTALDVVAPVLAAAWAMGRLLGPQLMEAGGGHATHQWFGMYYADQAGRRLPVPIFQALEDFSIFLVLLYVERRIARRAAGRTGYPAGTVIGVGMVLWGIERFFDERLWLAYPGQLGDVLVEIAGIALVVGGIVLLVVTRRRWREWEATTPLADPAAAVAAGTSDHTLVPPDPVTSPVPPPRSPTPLQQSGAGT